MSNPALDGTGQWPLSSSKASILQINVLLCKSVNKCEHHAYAAILAASFL